MLKSLVFLLVAGFTWVTAQAQAQAVWGAPNPTPTVDPNNAAIICEPSGQNGLTVGVCVDEMANFLYTNLVEPLGCTKWNMIIFITPVDAPWSARQADGYYHLNVSYRWYCNGSSMQGNTLEAAKTLGPFICPGDSVYAGGDPLQCTCPSQPFIGAWGNMLPYDWDGQECVPDTVTVNPFGPNSPAPN